jgi:polyphenol oxidase
VSVNTAQHSALSTQHSDGVPHLQFPQLAAEAGLVHGIFTRAGGVSDGPYASLNVSLAVGDDRERVLENRRRAARALDADPGQVYGARQVHGAAWRVVDAALAPAEIEREPYDILLSGTPDHLLLLKFADCTPLILWDARRRWVAVAHAGWRGTAADVAGVAVRALAAVAGSDPSELWAGVGPCIGPCCYEVGAEVVEAVSRVVPDAATVWRRGPAGRPHLELAVANQQQLQAAGVRPERILTADQCTACEADTFFSHRALGFPAGRFAVAAGVRA